MGAIKDTCYNLYITILYLIFGTLKEYPYIFSSSYHLLKLIKLIYPLHRPQYQCQEYACTQTNTYQAYLPLA